MFEKGGSSSKQKMNGGLLLSAYLTAKYELNFVLSQENAFSSRFYFKANIKILGFSKKRY